MFRKGFFTSTTWTINGDGFAIGNNAEGADFLAKILYTVLGDGAAAVTTTGFQTVKKTGLTCTVKPFFIAKSGYCAWDTADTDIMFTSSTSEQVFYISARLDLANNTYTGGIAARTTFVAGTDLVSAKITIPANAVALTDGMIEDLRYNKTYCGQIDEYRERSLALIAELEVALDALIAGGVPAHASTHAAGGADPVVRRFTAAFPAADWDEIDGTHQQTVSASGMTADMRPKCDILFDDEDALADRLAQKEAWLLVDDVDSGDGTITLTCFDGAPETDFTIQMEVIL